MVNIKVEHKETVRRFTLPSNASWIDLEGKLRTLFNIPKLTPFTLSYTDEDNDVITLSTDIELHEIFASNPTIKFNLKFSTTDDLSDSDCSDDWVLEGARKSAAPASTIETDNSVLQSNVSNVSHKNIISSTNQEPQYIENENDNDIIDETLNKKVQVDDDFERLEKSPSNVEEVEELPNDIERVEKLPNDVESVEKSPSNVESVEKSPNDIERVEESPNDAEMSERSDSPSGIERIEKVVRVEKSPSGIERIENVVRVEKLPNDAGMSERSVSPVEVERVERSSTDLFVERSSNDSDRVEISLNDVDRVENSSNKKISRVNLLDDEFFESFNSFKISPTIAPFEPRPIPQPQPQPQREVEDEQEDEETIGSSSNFSPFLERIQPQRRQQDQDSDIEEELRVVIGKYVKKDPQLAASVIDEIRSSIHVDHADHADHERLEPFHRPTQSKEDKRNYFRQRPITSPISGRSRSATPPRSIYNNRSSTPDYNRSSTGYNRSSARSSTPDSREYNRSPSPTPDYTRSSTPPILPGSFPVPASTPCLWVNDNEPPRPDVNMNQRGRRSRGRGRGGYRYRNRSQRNAEQSTNVGEETPDREETPEQRVYRENVQYLNDMGFEKFEDRYDELLTHHKGNMDLIIEVLVSLNIE